MSGFLQLLMKRGSILYVLLKFIRKTDSLEKRLRTFQKKCEKIFNLLKYNIHRSIFLFYFCPGNNNLPFQ